MKLNVFFSALIGFMLGVGVMWILIQQTTGKAFGDQYVVGVIDQANVALHIRAGKQMELLANIEAALPGYAVAVDEEFKGHADSTSALWMLKAYYERNEIVIPEEIRSILDRLPEKPPTSCQILLGALDDAATP